MSEMPAEETETVTVIEEVSVMLVLDSDGDQAMIVRNTSSNLITALGMIEYAKSRVLEEFTIGRQEE